MRFCAVLCNITQILAQVACDGCRWRFRDGLRESTIEVYGTYHKKYYKDSDAGCWVWAKDEQSAVKIASEYRTILLGSHPEAVELARQSEDSKAFIISNGEIKEMEYK